MEGIYIENPNAEIENPTSRQVLKRVVLKRAEEFMHLPPGSEQLTRKNRRALAKSIAKRMTKRILSGEIFHADVGL